MLISLYDHVQSDLLYLPKPPAAPVVLRTAPLPCCGEENGGDLGGLLGAGVSRRSIGPADVEFFECADGHCEGHGQQCKRGYDEDGGQEVGGPGCSAE